MRQQEIYAQMNAALDGNRKIMKAGRDGRDVFLWVLRQIALRGTDGGIPAREVQDSEWLARILMCSEAEARTGLERAIAADLLKIEGDECIATGWTPAHGRNGGKPGSVRTAEWRERKRAESVDACDVTVTDAVTCDVTVTTRDGVTQRKKERKKEGATVTRASAPRKAPLPPGWQPSEDLSAIAREEGVSLRRELAKLSDWAKADGAKKLDWTATARGWLRRAGADRRKARQPPEVDRDEPVGLFAARPAQARTVRDDEAPVKFMFDDLTGPKQPTEPS